MTVTHNNLDAGVDREQKGGDLVEVHCDYISADEPIKKKFPSSSTLVEVKKWAREEFVPNPPSDKVYYLSDDKTRHRFTRIRQSCGSTKNRPPECSLCQVNLISRACEKKSTIWVRRTPELGL